MAHIVKELQSQALAAVNSIALDLDVSPLLKLAKNPANIDEIHALLTNKTLLKYSGWLVVVVVTAAIAGRRNRSPVYVLAATLACAFFAPTLIPILTGNPIQWIQNEQLIQSALLVSLASLLVLRHLLILPVRVVVQVVIAVAASSVIVAGWKTGLTAFKSTTGALIVAGGDAVARPLALALEALLIDGAPLSLSVRTQWAGALAYGAALTVLDLDEKAAHVLCFAVLAVGFAASALGLAIDWFFIPDIILGLGRSVTVPAATQEVKAAAHAVQNAAQAVSPSKKNK